MRLMAGRASRNSEPAERPLNRAVAYAKPLADFLQRHAGQVQAPRFRLVELARPDAPGHLGLRKQLPHPLARDAEHVADLLQGLAPAVHGDDGRLPIGVAGCHLGRLALPCRRRAEEIRAKALAGDASGLLDRDYALRRDPPPGAPFRDRWRADAKDFSQSLLGSGGLDCLVECVHALIIRLFLTLFQEVRPNFLPGIIR